MAVTARTLSSASPSAPPAEARSLIAPVPEPQVLVLPSLYSFLQQVPDPRCRRGRRHPLAALLALICLASLSGICGYLPAHDWARSLPEAELKALGFTRRAPAASTLFLVLKLLSWEALETQLRRWLVAVQEALAAAPEQFRASTPAKGKRVRLPSVDAQAVAIDGKALRGSWKRGADIAGLLAVVSHELALTVAQVPLATKEGELTGIRPLLKKLMLKGLVITIDAQFTQPDLAQTICEQGGDYVMRVKKNQPLLLEDIRVLLSPAHYDPKRRRGVLTHETGHGRIETRQLVVHSLTDEQAADLAWPHARQVFVVITTRVKKGKPRSKATLLYGVTSLSSEEAGPERLLRLHRGHWTVENRAFWPRDAVLREDSSPAKAGNLVAVLACLRGAVMNLVRVSRSGEGMARTIRRYNADRAAALRALGCA